MTPVEVAAGYTVFDNNGARAEPKFLLRVVSADGKELERSSPQIRPVLDPRVAYLVTNLMEDVVNRGTGSVVRARGFTAPAAGKTGTSRDGWFAGFTSNLLCVVWVGFDDNRDLGLSGSSSAGPVWAEFMKRAVTLPAFRKVEPFAPPAGVVEVMVNPATGLLAAPECPDSRREVFISGTEPTEYCGSGHASAAGGPATWLSRLLGKSEPPSPAQPAAPGEPVQATQNQQQSAPPGTNPPGSPGADAQKKKGMLQRIFGIFGGSKKPADGGPKPDP
jgi:penicillin-binding protein 1B